VHGDSPSKPIVKTPAEQSFNHLLLQYKMDASKSQLLALALAATTKQVAHQENATKDSSDWVPQVASRAYEAWNGKPYIWCVLEDDNSPTPGQLDGDSKHKVASGLIYEKSYKASSSIYL
jgi:hypothetical protein